MQFSGEETQRGCKTGWDWEEKVQTAFLFWSALSWLNTGSRFKPFQDDFSIRKFTPLLRYLLQSVLDDGRYSNICKVELRADAVSLHLNLIWYFVQIFSSDPSGRLAGGRRWCETGREWKPWTVPSPCTCHPHNNCQRESTGSEDQKGQSRLKKVKNQPRSRGVKIWEKGHYFPQREGNGSDDWCIRKETSTRTGLGDDLSWDAEGQARQQAREGEIYEQQQHK